MSNHTPLYPRTENPRNAQRSDSEWMALIQEQRISGKSRENWCRENNINHKSMGSAEKRYASRLEDIMVRQDSYGRDGDNTGVIDETHKIEGVQKNDSQGWVEVGIKSELPMPQMAEASVGKEASRIIIRCGKLEIEADENYPPTHLEILIAMVIRLTPNSSSVQLGKLVTAC